MWESDNESLTAEIKILIFLIKMFLEYQTPHYSGSSDSGVTAPLLAFMTVSCRLFSNTGVTQH